jgi:hypothetical protein
MPSRAGAPLFADPLRGRPPGVRNHGNAARATTPEIADHRLLGLSAERSVRTRLAGIFLFWPLLAQIGFDRLVQQAHYPGSEMIPAVSALLSLLTLKLLDKERRSHINDFNFDEALGLFAGLNVLPKKSFATDYSYRCQHIHQQQLLRGWISQLSPLLFPQADTFNLDFHPIPYRGDTEGLDNHYLPRRGKAGLSVLTFFAQEQKSRIICYGNANLTRAEQDSEVLRFVDFWQALSGRDPSWLYFDSKLTSYAELSRLNQRDIWFVTIRRRGAGISRHLDSLPDNAWHRAHLDIPKRLYKDIRYVDETIRVDDFEGELRQVAVTGLGRERYTLILSNNFAATPRDLVMRYASRNGIEDGLGISVNFFHLDCLASEVRLNVDLDVALTVIANGCYRWLASKLKGFEKAKPKELYRKFVETSGRVDIGSEGIQIHFDRRAHNPILREAHLERACPPIPWLPARRLEFSYS